MKTKSLFTIGVAWLLATTLGAQTSRPLPILQTNPDTRAAAMGDVTLGHTERMYLFTNPSALLFQNKKISVDISSEIYPKTDNVVADAQRVVQLNAATAYRFKENQAAFLGFRYYKGLKTTFIDETENVTHTTTTPYDWTIDAGYAIRIHQFSINATANLTASWIGKAAYTGSYSLGAHYETPLALGTKTATLGLSAKVADVGIPLFYSKDMQYALPTSLIAGSSLALQCSPTHQFHLQAGARYFFLPSDAKFLTAGVGAEYGYRHFLFARAGYRYADRQQSAFTVGLGVKCHRLSFDLGYKLATSDYGINTAMFSLGYAL